MIPKQHWLQHLIINAFFLLLSVAGLVWDLTSGLLASGIDGIMLAAVCLLMALIFAGMLFVQLQEAGIVPSFGRKQKAATASPASAKAAAAPATQPAAAQKQPAQPQPSPAAK